jgi:hypothetical protein
MTSFFAMNVEGSETHTRARQQSVRRAHRLKPSIQPRARCTIAPARPRRRYAPGAPTVETFFTALLVVVFLLVTWFAGFVVVKLFKGQTR